MEKAKRSLLLIFIIGNVTFSFAQFTKSPQIIPNGHEGRAYALYDGDETFSVYYGPRLLKQLHFETQPSSSLSHYNIKDLGTIGVSSEYMVSEFFGLGCDLQYSRSEFTWGKTASVFNPNTGLYEQHVYDYDIKVPSYAVLFRTNVHLNWFFDDSFDWYLIVALGYRKTKFNVRTNDPDYKLNVNELYDFGDPTFPVTGKFGFGFRYFFTDLIGANIEVGFGQPGIGGGITLRF